MLRVLSAVVLAIASLAAGSAVLGLGSRAIAIASPGRVTANSATFHDATGENAGSADITTVVVSNDDAGLITVRIEIPSHLELTEDMRIRIWLDADDDPSTGLAVDALAGLDHFLLVDRWELGLGTVGLFRCSGSTCSGGSRPETSLRFSYVAGRARFTFAAADLGVKVLARIRFSIETAAGIRFDPATRRYDFTNARYDVAPEQGRFWTYESRHLLVKSFSAAPARPSAGRPFALRMTAIRTDTGAVLASGKVSCASTIAGKALRARSRGFVRKQAVCVFDIPPAAKGQRFRSSITIVFAGARVARSLSGRVG